MKSLFLSILGMLLIPSILLADEITIVADVWCPYNCEPGSDKPGFMIEIAQYALQKAGHQVVYKTLPWARAIEEVRKGNNTAVVGAAVDDTPDFVFPEIAIGVSRPCFYVDKSNPWKYQGIDSLSSIRLGAILDYAYGEGVDRYIETNRETLNVQIVPGETALEQNVQKLLSGRIDVFIEGEMVMGNFLKQSRQETLVKSAGCYEESQEVFVAFSPALAESREYAKILSEGMQELRTSGALQKILESYGLKDWK
jgi:polar amino acid transport system substrate-binding protein